MDQLVIGNRQGLSNWARQFKTVLDLKNHVYKMQESLFGIFKWGEFKPLPKKIDYVLIFKNSFVKCECGIDADENPHSYYQISLVHNNNRRIVVHETKNKEEAFEMAISIASDLHVRLKDSASTRGQSKWMELPS